jgi:hypothetical protein
MSNGLRIVVAAICVLALVMSVAALAAPGKGKGQGAKAAASQYQYGKVTICHKGKTITVGAPAVKAHVRNHGDRLGAC